jgi:hypothetical protein
MAGDWIKVEKATARKPEVMAVADALGIHVDHAFGLCVRFWFWCDDQMTDGHALSVTNVTLDASFGHAGFASALVKVGWLRVRNGSLEVPNFDRHLSESAKNRALSGRRQQKRRGETVTEMSRSERDKCVTREEKSKREELHTHTGPPAASRTGAGEPEPWRKPGWAHDEWQALAATWNVTERAAPWPHATPPNGFADLAASPGWLESARKGMAMLPACRMFDTPVPWTQFVAKLDRILAGEFREPKDQGRRGTAAAGRTPRRGNL